MVCDTGEGTVRGIATIEATEAVAPGKMGT